MFDDPNKELQKLEDQLLKAEMNQEAAELNNEEFEELYGNILAEFGPREKNDGTTEAAAEPAIRNFANGYGQSGQTQTVKAGDEILGDDEPAVPKKGVKGLVFLSVLEIAAIAALAAYWIRHIL